jgi:hypothetical protein
MAAVLGGADGTRGGISGVVTLLKMTIGADGLGMAPQFP